MQRESEADSGDVPLGRPPPRWSWTFGG